MPAVLVPNHMLKPFRQRILGTYVLPEAAMRLARHPVQGTRPTRASAGAVPPANRLTFSGPRPTLRPSSGAGPRGNCQGSTIEVRRGSERKEMIVHQITRRHTLAGLGAIVGSAALPAFAQRDDSVFLLSYFTDKDEGRDGLKLAFSEDGYVFTPLGGGRGFLKPEVGNDKLMRDPHLSQGPDGLWHLVWTSDWFGPVIGHSTSRDLVHWSAQQTIPVMTGFTGVRNSWAPEAIYDRKARDFVIIWSSSIDGRYGATAGERFEGLKLRPYFTARATFGHLRPQRSCSTPGRTRSTSPCSN